MKILTKYRIVILIKDEFNNNELNNWIFDFLKYLKKVYVHKISVNSHGKQKLAYMIKQELKGNLIQFNFLSLPKSITTILKKLKIDPNIIRSIILKEK